MYIYISNGKLNTLNTPTSLVKCSVKDQEATKNYICMFLGMHSVEVYQIIVRTDFYILFISPDRILVNFWYYF